MNKKYIEDSSKPVMPNEVQSLLPVTTIKMSAPSITQIDMKETTSLVQQAFAKVLESLGRIFESEFARTLGNIQETLQMPFAMKAFSASLGLTKSIFDSPSLELLKSKMPALNVPIVDWKAVEDRYESTLGFAAQNNWFIQPETGSDFSIEIEECHADIDRLNILFAEMTKSIKTEIQARLLRDHPKHAAQVVELFLLHDEGRYLASIPLTMIVAEGIAYQASNSSIFNMKRNRPEIAGWLDGQQLTGLAKIFLSSLNEQFPMSKPRLRKLSRHNVLHGRDTDYGSELFSLQAIAILGFVGWAFAEDGLVKANDESEE